VEKHPLYWVGEAALECILKARPRTVVVENVLGWDKKASMDNGPSHLRKFINRLSSQYWCKAMRLSLRPWVAAERDRVYLIAVRHDTGGPESLAYAHQIIKARRPTYTASNVARVSGRHEHVLVTSHHQLAPSGHHPAPGEEATDVGG
jgi:hypothetical protein